MTHQQVIALLQHLQQQHPDAFKHNPLFYSLLKTKGILDDPKEALPWVLAIMIFVCSAIALAEYISTVWQDLSGFQYMGSAILILMLIIRLYSPLIIWQIKHSSTLLYQHLKNTSLKLSIVLILQGLNLIYIESAMLQYVLFFFALSFGFVRFYKENLFSPHTTAEQYYYLQQIRRANLWAYKKAQQSNRQLAKAQQTANPQLKEQQIYFNELHQTLTKYEQQMYNQYKYQDIESYMDDIK